MNNSPLKKVIVPKKKRIAIVAHDGLKTELFAWMANKVEILNQHSLCGTGTTSTIIRENFGLDIHSYNSGPLGGDQQIGAAISNGEIDLLIFFWDPMKAQPHDPDVKALLRIAVLYDVPVAMSPLSASILLESDFLDKENIKYVPNGSQNVKNRIDKFDLSE
ncbi:MAG: methylglyoxal synthase [Tissierellia bacterium]|nr:methylglyoxal synthase [Tissierellia bacterium]